MNPATPLPVTYVVGSSHSGSTLLALLADEHPQVASVGETAIKRQIRREGRAAHQRCSCGAPVGDCAFWQRIARRVAACGGSPWAHEYRFDNQWLDMLLTRETSVTPLRRLRRWAARHAPGYRRRVARIDRANVCFVRAVLDEVRATVFLDTTKLLTRLERLLDVPALDVRVVRLVRDVRGVAVSASRRGRSLATAARIWRNDQVAIARALRALPPDRVLLMRYEDLCTNPGATLDRLWRFCGVAPFTPPPTVRSSDHHVIGNSARLRGLIEVRLDDRWTALLDAADQRQVLRIAGSLHQQLGYA